MDWSGDGRRLLGGRGPRLGGKQWGSGRAFDAGTISSFGHRPIGDALEEVEPPDGSQPLERP